MKAGVCLSNLRGKSRGSLGRLLVRWSRRHTLLYGLGWEIHSLLLRMGELRKQRLDRGIRIDPLPESAKDGPPIPCTDTHARTWGIQVLIQRYP